MIVDSVLEFRTKFGLPIPSEPTEVSASEALHQFGCLQEELVEYETHMNGELIGTNAEDSEGMLDALVDLVYFAVGIAIRRGWDFEEAFRRVHAANMAKELAGSSPNKRQSPTDLIKPDGWEPASLRDLVEPRITTVRDVQLCGMNGSSYAGAAPSELKTSCLPAIVRFSEDLPGLSQTG